jgi:hypothetical protein
MQTVPYAKAQYCSQAAYFAKANAQLQSNNEGQVWNINNRIACMDLKTGTELL